MKKHLGFAVCLLLSCGPSGPPEPPSGAEFVFKVLNRPSDPAATVLMLRDTTRIIERRLALLGFAHARATALGVDRLKIRIPGAGATNLGTVCRAILGGQGLLRVFELAEAPIQEAYNRSNVVPEGYWALANDRSEERPPLPDGKAWDVERVLIRTDAVVDHRTIRDAWVEPSSKGAGVWNIALALSDEGASRFASAAGRSRLVSVVLNGKLRSIARVIDIGGREVRITDSSGEGDAKILAYILLSQSGQAMLGSDSTGKAVPDKPDSFTYYGKPAPTSPKHEENR